MQSIERQSLQAGA